jgi:hypothetical protein
MDPIMGLDIVEKRKLFCVRRIRNMITTLTDVKNKTTTIKTTDVGGGGSSSSASVWRK